MDVEAINQAQAELARERGWLDTKRIDALLKLGRRYRVSLADAAKQASWLTSEQVEALASLPGGATISRTWDVEAIPGTHLPTTGDRLGDYVLGEKLGEGGMGSVYVGRHHANPSIERAVKVAYVGLGDDVGRERFTREAQALAKLDRHAGVVRVHGFDLLENGIAYYVMDRIEGRDLKSTLQEGVEGLERRLELARDLARALARVHAAGIVHRDLKPANVMIRADTGGVVLTDFGLARDLDALRITQSQTLVGTPTYMAPEQVMASNHLVGPPADVFALGGIYYELFTGKPPFAAFNIAQLLQSILTVDPVPPSHLTAGLPRDLDRVVLAMLDKELERRPSAAEVAGWLEAIASGERPFGEDRSRRLGLAAAAAGALLLIVAAALLASVERPPPAPESPAVAPESPSRTELAARRVKECEAALAAGETERAWRLIESAIELAPSATAYATRATMSIRKRDLRAALADCSRALALDPAHGQALNQRGMVRFEQGDLVAAVADFDAALNRGRIPIVLYNRASAQLRLRRFARARADVLEALTDPGLGAAGYGLLGRIEYAERRLEPAERACSKSLEHEDDAEVRYIRAQVRARRGDPSGAKLDLKRCLELKPTPEVRRRAEALLKRLRGR